jgi:hypothetical protein
MLLGYYGLYWSFKNRLPAAWPGVEDEDEDDERDDEDERKDDEEDEDDEDERDDEPDDAEDEKAPKEPAVDPDVEGEFDKDGRLKRNRESS